MKQVWIWIENCWTSKKNEMMKGNTKIHVCNFIHSFGLRIVAKSKQSNFCMDKYICDCMRAFITNIHCIPLLFWQITALKIKHNPFAKAFLDAKERWVRLTPDVCVRRGEPDLHCPGVLDSTTLAHSVSIKWVQSANRQLPNSVLMCTLGATLSLFALHDVSIKCQNVVWLFYR